MKIEKLTKIINLSTQLAISDFKLKNEGSFFGLLWYVFNPILLFTLLYFVFRNNLGNDIHYYSLYLLLGILMYNFFQSVTSESTRTIISENNHLIKSINFPRESLIIAIVLKNIFSHIIEIFLFGILLIYFGLNFLNLFFYILILFLFCLFLIGISLILSSLTVYFTDLDNVWNFLTRLLLFVTPIFYVIENNQTLLYVNYLNPLYYYIEIARDVIIYNRFPETNMIIGSLCFSLIFFAIGQIIFRKYNKKIAELI